MNQEKLPNGRVWTLAAILTAAVATLLGWWSVRPHPKAAASSSTESSPRPKHTGQINGAWTAHPASSATAESPPVRARIDEAHIRLSAPPVSASAPPPPPLRIARAPWEIVGMCGSAARQREWLSYLRAFRPVPGAVHDVVANFRPEAKLLFAVDGAFESTRADVRRTISLDAPPPRVYLHASLDELRRHGCVNEGAVAFYDGSIHLALDRTIDEQEMVRSLRHEYTHHALLSHGVHEPIWLQEALAMAVGGEAWNTARLQEPGIDLREMVDAFPQTASVEYARTFYRQASGMLDLIHKLCEAPPCPDAALVKALETGAVSPQNLFDWAIRQAAPTAKEPASQLWQRYLAEARSSGSAFINESGFQ